jgi:hypothetical protein
VSPWPKLLANSYAVEFQFAASPQQNNDIDRSIFVAWKVDKMSRNGSFAAHDSLGIPTSYSREEIAIRIFDRTRAQRWL